MDDTEYKERLVIYFTILAICVICICIHIYGSYVEYRMGIDNLNRQFDREMDQADGIQIWIGDEILENIEERHAGESAEMI